MKYLGKYICIESIHQYGNHDYFKLYSIIDVYCECFEYINNLEFRAKGYMITVCGGKSKITPEYYGLVSLKEYRKQKLEKLEKLNDRT